jgi:RND superfamily putative drug exporter
MWVLLLANYKGTASLGPTLAIGIAIMVLAGLTLLPALLAILGRKAFWPAIPREGSEPHGRVRYWQRIGHFVHDRSVFVMIAVIIVLVAGSLGNFKPRGTLDFGEGFRDPPESVVGQDLIKEKLSGGETAPTEAVVASGASTKVADALKQVEGVSQVVPTETSKDGRFDQLSVTLTANPFSDDAADTIPKLRDAAQQAAGGRLALVGGSTAENYDTSNTLRADAKVIVPLILLVIFFILCFLLRAVVAPAYLVLTVILSFAFALGASYLIFDWFLGQDSSDAGLPTFAFIFLVALGVDYNIFLMSRIREEAEHEETKEAVIEGLEKTGGVISSAGLILAGTFASLMALPLEALFQIGFVVAFGLLVDTFIVRTLLVPSIAFQLDEKNWWPSRIVRKPRPKIEAKPKAKRKAKPKLKPKAKAKPKPKK